MAWSDAAREAALIARRQHATGKKLKTSQSLYHGAHAPIKGNDIKTAASPYHANQKLAFASKDLQWTRGFAKRSVVNGRRLTHDNFRVYAVTVVNPIRQGGEHVASRLPMHAKALPRAKGRASRGKY